MKKFLTEADRKKMISEREKNILESFAKNFNKIKRIDENKVNEFEEDNELYSRSVQHGINHNQEQPDMDSINLDIMKQHLEWLESMIINYDRAEMFDKKDEVEQQYYKLRNEISNLEQGNELPF